MMRASLPPPQPDWAYFFDIDGTLVDLADLPTGTRPDSVFQRLIEASYRSAGGAVALQVSRHAFPSHELDGVRRRLADAVARHPGLFLEDKGLSLAVHYRRAPRLAAYVHRLVHKLVTPLGTRYCVLPGKRILEVKPAGKDKGVAVQEFMQETPFRGRTPVFVGDDVTDEFGFKTVNRLDGHSIKVGPGRTVARWRLGDVEAVRAWLEQGFAAVAG